MMPKNILVTGSHRSGSTWIGKTLCSTNELIYLDEPMHGSKYKPIASPVKYWYTYLDPNKPNAKFQMYVNLFTNPKKLSVHPGRFAFCIYQTLQRKGTQKPYLFKDPLALFSTEWFIKYYDVQPILLVRHPCAFALSLKKKEWYHDFSHFVKQKELMHQFPEYIQKEILLLYNSQNKNIIDHASLLWSIIHLYILQLKDRIPEIILRKHEDFLLDPVAEFSDLFYRLDLSFNDKAKSFIIDSTQSDTATPLRRDIKKEFKKWKTKLSKEEIQKIRDKTQRVANQFYSNSDW